MKKLLGIAFIGILLITANGCGQKGPLRRPQQVNFDLPASQPVQQVTIHS